MDAQVRTEQALVSRASSLAGPRGEATARRKRARAMAPPQTLRDWMYYQDHGHDDDHALDPYLPPPADDRIATDLPRKLDLNLARLVRERRGWEEQLKYRGFNKVFVYHIRRLCQQLVFAGVNLTPGPSPDPHLPRLLHPGHVIVASMQGGLKVDGAEVDTTQISVLGPLLRRLRREGCTNGLGIVANVAGKTVLVQRIVAKFDPRGGR